MKKLTKVSVLLLLVSAVSQAQEWNEAQTEVWTAVLGSYVDIDNNDANWTDKWVTDDAVVWGSGFPMPRTRDSIKRWNGYQFPQSETMMSEYSPAAIVVHDNTAVAHTIIPMAPKTKKANTKPPTADAQTSWSNRTTRGNSFPGIVPTPPATIKLFILLITKGAAAPFLLLAR